MNPQQNKVNSPNNTMLINTNYTLKNILVLLLIPILVIAITDNAYSNKSKSTKKKNSSKNTRTYNRASTKNHAIEILKTSTELSEIAKIEPHSNGSNGIESQAYLAEYPTNKSPEITYQSNDIALIKTYLYDDNEDDTIGEMGEDIDELEAEDDIKIDLDDFRSI
jgi:hypothetical protein